MLTASGIFPQETRPCLSRLSIMIFHIPPNASKDYLHNKVTCVSLNKCMMMVMKIDQQATGNRQQATDTADVRQRYRASMVLNYVIKQLFLKKLNSINKPWPYG